MPSDPLPGFWDRAREAHARVEAWPSSKKRAADTALVTRMPTPDQARREPVTEHSCPSCDGSGWLDSLDARCPACQGSGKRDQRTDAMPLRERRG